MNKLKTLLLLGILSLVAVGCDKTPTSNSDSVTSESTESVTDSVISSSTDTTPDPADFIDYVAITKLDLNDTSKIYAEVKVKRYVDGDTTHFVPVDENIDNWIDDEEGYLKARYNSVDTPESTGKVEIWGKSASYFTHDKLASANSIIVQSDTNKWSTDSTGGRYLVWVWYQPEAGADYRLLNLELVQEGLASLKSASAYSLFETFMAANSQAQKYKMRKWGSDIDPNWYYGDAIPVTMKELRLHTADYSSMSITVEGTVTVWDPYNHMAYAEDIDPEDGRAYGMNFYAGFNTNLPLTPGYRLRLVGTVQFYNPDDSDNEELGSWQVSGMTYLPFNSDEYDGSIKILEKGVEIIPMPVTVDDLLNPDIYVSEKEDDDDPDIENTITIGESYESVHVQLDNLTVKSAYTSHSTDSTKDGAMTLTCVDSNNKQITVRTAVIKKSDNTLLTEDEVLNKTISIKGIVTKYNGKIQVRVFKYNDFLQIA